MIEQMIFGMNWIQKMTQSYVWRIPGDSMNKFLNENWQEVYGELKDAIQKAFAEFIIGPVKSVFEKVPFDSIIRP